MAVGVHLLATGKARGAGLEGPESCERPCAPGSGIHHAPRRYVRIVTVIGLFDGALVAVT